MKATNPQIFVGGHKYYDCFGEDGNSDENWLDGNVDQEKWRVV